MRLFQVLTIVLVGMVLVGVVVLIVVEIADYDGRTAAEIGRDERERHGSLQRCPQGEPGDFGEEHDPGTEGETVPPGPTSALVCISTQVGGQSEGAIGAFVERVIRDRADLTRLTAALNSLPPAVPLGEGIYNCGAEENFYDLIALHYDGAPEVQIAVAPGICGDPAVLNLGDEEEFVGTIRLLRLLDRLSEA